VLWIGIVFLCQSQDTDLDPSPSFTLVGKSDFRLTFIFTAVSLHIILAFSSSDIGVIIFIILYNTYGILKIPRKKDSLAFYRYLPEMDTDPDSILQNLDADPDQNAPKLCRTDRIRTNNSARNFLSLIKNKKNIKTLNGRRGSPPQTSLRCSSISVSVSTSRPRNVSSWPSGKILYCYCRYYFASAYLK
jgi:hypothetical protein